MSLNYTSLLKLSVAGAILLSVGACKAADKGQGALKSDALAALDLNRADASVFGKYFETESCDADEMESLGALAGLGLGENGSNGVSFASRTVENGKVMFDDLKVTRDEDIYFTAKSVNFHCPQMGEDAPSFDRLDVTDARISQDDIVFSFDAMSVVRPTPDAALALIDGMMDTEKAEGENIGVEAVSLSGVSIKGEEISGSLTNLVWGETRDEDENGIADLMVGDADMTFTDKNTGKAVTVDFDGMNVRSLNVGKELTPAEMTTPEEMMSNILGNMQTFEKPYDTMEVGTLNVASEFVDVNFKGMEGETKKKGSVLTTRQSMKPLQIVMKPAMGEVPDMAQVYGTLKSLGFETITLSGSSVTELDEAKDTITVSDGLYVMEDAFRLNFEYKAEGLDAMVQKLKAQEEQGGADNPMAGFDALKLSSMRFTLEDNSIVERGLKLASEMTGQSETTIKMGLGMAVMGVAMAAENELQTEVYTESMEAFAEFVKKGGTLTIEANPPEPFSLVPLFTAKGADVDPATLGFSASQAGGNE